MQLKVKESGAAKLLIFEILGEAAPFFSFIHPNPTDFQGGDFFVCPS